MTTREYNPRFGDTGATSLRVGAAILWLTAAGCGVDTPADAPHDPTAAAKSIHEVTDASGRVSIQIRVCGPSASEQRPEIKCRLEDPNFLLVGGGASVNFPNMGALLVASEPDPDAPDRTWRVQSKDHLHVEQHQITAYAVGMKLGNIGPKNQRKYMHYDYGVSPPGQFNADAQLPAGWRVLGGGGAVLANLDHGDPGALLTGTFPTGARGWRTEAKDHMMSSRARVRGWIIGLQDVSIPGFGRLDVQAKDGNFVDTNAGERGHSAAVVDNGWLAAGGGAKVEWFGLGRMLYILQPAFTAFAALDKDHDKPDSGRLRTWVMQVRAN